MLLLLHGGSWSSHADATLLPFKQLQQPQAKRHAYLVTAVNERNLMPSR